MWCSFQPHFLFFSAMSDIQVTCGSQAVDLQILLCPIYFNGYNESLLSLNSQHSKEACKGTPDWTADPPVLKFNFSITEEGISTCSSNMVVSALYLKYSITRVSNLRLLSGHRRGRNRSLRRVLHCPVHHCLGNGLLQGSWSRIRHVSPGDDVQVLLPLSTAVSGQQHPDERVSATWVYPADMGSGILLIALSKTIFSLGNICYNRPFKIGSIGSFYFFICIFLFLGFGITSFFIAHKRLWQKLSKTNSPLLIGPVTPLAGLDLHFTGLNTRKTNLRRCPTSTTTLKINSSTQTGNLPCCIIDWWETNWHSESLEVKVFRRLNLDDIIQVDILASALQKKWSKLNLCDWTRSGHFEDVLPPKGVCLSYFALRKL